MKLSIVTVYNSLNSGSFLQAFTLMKALEKNNIETSFLKTKARNPSKEVLLSSLKSLSKGELGKFVYLIKKYIKFRKIVIDLPKINMSKKDMEKQNGFILGSDEIWNVKRSTFNQYPIFWGLGIRSKNIMAYAPSINRAASKDILKYDYIKSAINDMKFISVRDNHSKQILEELSNKEIDLVLDPTMLFDAEFYNTLEAPINDHNYILVYSYSNHFNEEQIKNIKEFAVMKNLPLISVNHKMEWCDKSVPVSPFEFLAYYNNANYVITDTFHGTIFSIIYNKHFLSYGDDNVKVLDLLNRLNLNDQNYDGTTDVSFYLNKEINYEKIMKNLENQKNNSVNYLENAIKHF